MYKALVALQRKVHLCVCTAFICCSNHTFLRSIVFVPGYVDTFYGCFDLRCYLLVFLPVRCLVESYLTTDQGSAKQKHTVRWTFHFSLPASLFAHSTQSQRLVEDDRDVDVMFECLHRCEDIEVARQVIDALCDALYDPSSAVPACACTTASGGVPIKMDIDEMKEQPQERALSSSIILTLSATGLFSVVYSLCGGLRCWCVISPQFGRLISRTRALLRARSSPGWPSGARKYKMLLDHNIFGGKGFSSELLTGEWLNESLGDGCPDGGSA